MSSMSLIIQPRELTAMRSKQCPLCGESDGRTAAYFEFRQGIKGMLPALRKPGDLDRAELFLRYSCFKDPISVLPVILQETRYRLPVRDLDLGALGAQPTRRY